MSEWESLLQQAREGDREAARELWTQGLEEASLSHLIEATKLLSYQEKLAEAWVGSLDEKKSTKLFWLAEAFGLALTKKDKVALEKGLKQANGRRRGQARLELSELLLLLREVREREQGARFHCSHATQAGGTAVLTGCVDGFLRVAITKVIPNTYYLQEGDDGYYEYMEEWQLEQIIQPNAKRAFGEDFEGWDNWEQATREEAFATWMAHNDTIDIELLPLHFTSDDSELIVTPAGEVLPEQQNERLARCLGIIEDTKVILETLEDEELMEQSWKALLEEWKGWPKETMDDIELTLLDRALYDWPSRIRIYDLGAFEEELNYRPFQRLCRSFRIFAPGEGGLPISLLEDGFLSQATHLEVDLSCPEPLLRALFQDDVLTQVRGISLRHQAPLKPTLVKWLGGRQVWEELRSFEWEQSYAFEWEQSHTLEHQEKSSRGLLESILSHCERLEKLSLYNALLGKKATTHIAAMASLGTLEIFSCKVQQVAAEVWRDSLPPVLHTLSLRGDFPLVGSLGEACTQTKIKHLCIEQETETEGAIITDFDTLLDNPVFSQLESYRAGTFFGSCPLGIDALVKSQRAPHLRVLAIETGDGLVPEDAEALRQGEQFEALEVLEVTQAQWSLANALFALFVEGEPFPHLKELDLDLRVRENTDLTALLDLLPPTLKRLKLPMMEKINDNDGKVIAAWEGLKQLEELAFRPLGTFYKRARKAIESSPHFPTQATIDWG